MKTRLPGIGGMKRPKWDPRRFSYLKKFGAATAGQLPTDDRDAWTPLATKDQGANDLCTDYGTTGAAEPLTGIVNDEAFQRAAHNAVANTPGYVGGADPDQAALAAIKSGILPKSDSPYNVMTDDPATWADLSKWPGVLVTEAGGRKEFSKYTVDGQDDLFDSIRDAMFVTGPANNFTTVVMVGAEWRASWLGANGGVIAANDPNEDFSDHEFCIVGQKNIGGVLYLKAHLSSGQVGDCSVAPGGFFYFPREIVNAFLFARAFGPGSPNDYKANLWNSLQKLYDLLWNLIHPSQAISTSGTPSMTLAQAKQWARNLCAAVGLDPTNTEILIACVMVESGFNRSAINFNRDPATGAVTSIDYGIVQVNDGYHIGVGKDFATPEYVLSNPAACVTWMATLFKAGKQSLWSSYQSGAYKAYLNQ